MEGIIRENTMKQHNSIRFSPFQKDTKRLKNMLVSQPEDVNEHLKLNLTNEPVPPQTQKVN